MRAAVAVTKVQLRILRNDPWFLVIMFGMPLVVMPLLKDTIGLSLVSSGFEGATGAELVVPGQTEIAARLDVARTVVRRAERDVLPAVRERDSEALRYLNRLSDLLWTLARWQEGESLITKEL